MKKLLWIILGWMVLFASTQAASFDCDKATTSVEKLICGSPELRIADIQLYEIYMRAIRQSKNSNQIRSEQRQWLKITRSKSKSTTSLSIAYQERITQLESKITFVTCEADDTRYCNSEINNDYKKTISELVTLLSSRISSSEMERFHQIQDEWQNKVECSCEQETNEENGNGTEWSGYFVSCEKKERELRIQEIRKILAEIVGPTYGGEHPNSCAGDKPGS